MTRRLIEAAFPLREASLDSVHEKNVRHGHISTLHIWPARRPLAACRAALLATLLPDPGTDDGRRELRRRIGGLIEEKAGADGRMKEETVGGILHWGREGLPEVAALREEIREAFGGRAPRVLDPFAGGGAIPLEAMRLGCEVTASDINPVAWFILRCTLHYPRLVGTEKWALPAFVREDAEFLDALGKAQGVRRGGRSLFASGRAIEAEFAWHLRAWGKRVLDRARKKLVARYRRTRSSSRCGGRGRKDGHEPSGPSRPANGDCSRRTPKGEFSTDALNTEFDSFYLDDEANPRWVAKPTVAYLWARTAACGNCRAEIPLLKTRWLCKKAGKRVRLTMEAREDGRGVTFGVEGGRSGRRGRSGGAAGARQGARRGDDEPERGRLSVLRGGGDDGRPAGAGEGGAARRAYDGGGGGRAAGEGIPTADGTRTGPRLGSARRNWIRSMQRFPSGFPRNPTPGEGALGMRIPRYGFDRWRTLFTDRQLLTLGTFVGEIRGVAEELRDYPEPWREVLIAYLSLTVSRLADRGSSLATWTNDRDTIRSTFARFALPIVWDFAESCPLADTTGGFVQAVEWIARVVEHTQKAATTVPRPTTNRTSATAALPEGLDVICTDPPYYDAIPYSDLMDFFHVWLRRVLYGLSSETDAVFAAPLGPKWDADSGDGELIDDAARFGGNREASKQNYEDGMARSFSCFREALNEDGRLVIVFANKQPDAWETLVAALIESGFVVDASWPIQTEMQNRQRSLSSAALSSSIWLVCRKRSETRAGWDSGVLADMEANITKRLHDFWDAGIRGPDFVWAATGPALEAFSRYPAVRRQDAPGETLSVTEFLRHVRRMVVGFVVGRVLPDDDGGQRGELDNLTTYYLLHRRDFGLGAAPAGAVILYALSCDISDSDLAGRCDLIARGSAGGGDEDGEPAGASGGEAKLKPWDRRKLPEPRGTFAEAVCVSGAD